jgi:hypothetical protein
MWNDLTAIPVQYATTLSARNQRPDDQMKTKLEHNYMITALPYSLIARLQRVIPRWRL